MNDTNPIGQITIFYSPECKPVKNKPLLCNGVNIANFNAFRIEKNYEGQGHISRLVKMAEESAKKRGIKVLTIGSEAKGSRNLAIYLHFGYTNFVMCEFEQEELILYYSKNIL